MAALTLLMGCSSGDQGTGQQQGQQAAAGPQGAAAQQQVGNAAVGNGSPQQGNAAQGFGNVTGAPGGSGPSNMTGGQQGNMTGGPGGNGQGNMTDEQRQQMMQQAAAACEGKAEGDSCTVQGGLQGSMNATCGTQNGTLLCLPHMGGPGGYNGSAQEAPSPSPI